MRIGRLDPGALVAMTLRGRPLDGQPAGFCVTLASDDQPLQQVCGSLTPASASPRTIAMRPAIVES